MSDRNRESTSIGWKLVAGLMLWATLYGPLWAQATGTLSGTVTNPAGVAVADAHVSIRNLTTGQTTDAQTNTGGQYTVSNLAPGDYEVSASVDGLSSSATKVTLAAGTPSKADLSLASAPASSTAPSLGDLGISPAQAQGSAQNQHLLDKRSHMLLIHQRLGLITTAPLIATLITSSGAGGHKSTSSGRELHATLGGITAGMYLTTAYFSVFAPRVPGNTTRGPIRVHRALAWVHGPGMILTPILGALAYNQKNAGEKVHGLASFHQPVAWVTGIAYGAAIVSVSFKF